MPRLTEQEHHEIIRFIEADEPLPEKWAGGRCSNGDLLSNKETTSPCAQIIDENVHHVRELMDPDGGLPGHGIALL
jgi:hypothetical protein